MINGSYSTYNTALHGSRAGVDLAALPPDTLLDVTLFRPELALEAIASQRRLVLLGEPGAGKSTVLRYLAWLLAERLRGKDVLIPGWPATRADLPIPIICPLGQVAANLPRCTGDAVQALWTTLGDLLDGEQGLREGLRAHVRPALARGGVLLLCDGLGELPAEDVAGGSSPRAQVAESLRRLVGQAPKLRIVVTSRVLPYLAAATWQLRPKDG